MRLRANLLAYLFAVALISFPGLPGPGSTPSLVWAAPAALGFFAPDAETAALLQRFASSAAKDALLRSTIKTHANAGMDMRYEKVFNLPGGTLASITPGRTENGTPFITLKITEQGARNPMVVLEELVHLSQITGRSNIGNVDGLEVKYTVNAAIRPRNWREVALNAQAGSSTAQLTLAVMELDAIQVARQLAHGSPVFMGSASAEDIDAFFDRREAHAQANLNSAVKADTIASRKAKADWNTQRLAFDALEGPGVAKLNELVAKNDRTGVRRLLEKYLPWPLMEPYEKSAWKHWLEAIENPDPARLKVVFRGLDRGQILKHSGKEFMMATVLSKNQGNYNRRLRSFQTMREKIQKLAYMWPISSTPLPPSLEGIFGFHAGDPQGTPFISASELSVAHLFSGAEGIGVLRIDSRRLLPSPASRVSENEILIPLMVFPDEIVGRIPFEQIRPPATRESVGQRVRDLLTHKLGRAPRSTDFIFERQAQYVVKGIAAPSSDAWDDSRTAARKFIAAGMRELEQIFMRESGDAGLATCIKNAVQGL